MKPNKILRWWCNNNTRYSTKSAWIFWSPLEKKLQCSILVESFYLQAFSNFRNSVFTWWKEVFHGVPQKNELTNSVFTWWNEMFHGVPQKNELTNSVFTLGNEMFHRIPKTNELTNNVFTLWNEMFLGVPKEMNSQFSKTSTNMKTIELSSVQLA